MKLEDLQANSAVRGVLANGLVTVVSVQWFGSEALELTYKTPAGEGINLQRAHLMVNYDPPWYPNRLEQRFGRIHRIGQTEVCHLWNVVSDETREGDVYRKLLEKLEQARQSLGGQVFDVLGKLRFEGRPLRELLVEAIRYGEQPEVRARLTTSVSHALDRGRIQDMLEERALAHDTMDTSRVHRLRGAAGASGASVVVMWPGTR